MLVLVGLECNVQFLRTLFSFACVLPGHLCMCRTASDPVDVLQYATPVPVQACQLCFWEALDNVQVMPKSIEITISGRSMFVGCEPRFKPACIGARRDRSD